MNDKNNQETCEGFFIRQKGEATIAKAIPFFICPYKLVALQQVENQSE